MQAKGHNIAFAKAATTRWDQYPKLSKPTDCATTAPTNTHKHTKCLHTERSPVVTSCNISIRSCSELLFGVQSVRYKITSLLFRNTGQNIKTVIRTEIQKGIKESCTEWHHNEYTDLTL